MPGQERTDDDRHVWRVTGSRRWLPVLMLGLFVLQVLGRLYSVVLEPPPHLADGLLLALALVGSGAALAAVVVNRRTRVTLAAEGIEVRSGRRRLVRYADVTRAYRDRFNRGTVTLDLLDASKVVLPAPLAGLKDPAPELDEAVEEINARVRAARSGVEDVAPG